MIRESKDGRKHNRIAELDPMTEPMEAAAKKTRTTGRALKQLDSPQAITVQAPKMMRASIEIVGLTSLLSHRKSPDMIQGSTPAEGEDAAKAKLGGLRKRTKKVRDPQAEFKASLYELPDGKFGFPAISFKRAIEDAASTLGYARTQIRRLIYTPQEFVEIVGSKPRLRTDVAVNQNMRSASIVVNRAEFETWRCTLLLDFDSDFLTAETIANLLTRAGLQVGVGAWRNDKGGVRGAFMVKGIQVRGLSTAEYFARI